MVGSVQTTLILEKAEQAQKGLTEPYIARFGSILHILSMYTQINLEKLSMWCIWEASESMKTRNE